ncbi:MAG: dUTP diphosphatase [Saprospirales bacterium]|nr:MAG: dUTP diphosphatase [Saprospirales bacterium]
MNTEVAIINDSGNPLPFYATAGSAGLDLYANIHKELVLGPLERILVPTGIRIALPTGMEAQVRPRSGLAVKKGLAVLNSPGTIDSDYRGEIRILLVNLSNEEALIEPGERIAQMVVSQHCTVKWKEVDQLPDSIRGQGGFGSTGKR